MSNKLKLIIAIVLVIVMIPTMGTVYVKDNLRNTSYCASCHEEHYTTWAAPESEYSLAHQHAEMGVSCQSCHQRTVGESVMEVVDYATGNYYYPFPETELPMDNCFACHGSYAEIIPLTDPLITGEARNPHDGHWGELECGTCHKMHSDSIDYCASCHSSVTDSPGWTLPNP